MLSRLHSNSDTSPAPDRRDPDAILLPSRCAGMPETSTPIEIPNRALFKAAEVCELLKLQPYVLRSWEAEFPDLGRRESRRQPACLPPRRMSSRSCGSSICCSSKD